MLESGLCYSCSLPERLSMPGCHKTKLQKRRHYVDEMLCCHMAPHVKLYDIRNMVTLMKVCDLKVHHSSQHGLDGRYSTHTCHMLIRKLNKKEQS